MKKDKNRSDEIKADELLGFIDSIKTLFWRVDLVKNEIDFFNKSAIESLGDNIGLLLKSAAYAESVIFGDDRIRFESFKAAMMDGRPASIIFRLQGVDGSPSVWLKIMGAPSTSVPYHYIGYIQDISEALPFVRSMLDSDKKKQVMLENFDYPVLLVDMESKTILSHNSEAADLLGYNFDELNGLGFSELYHQEVSYHITKIYEKSLFEGKWEGKLLIARKNRSVFYADCVVRSLDFKGRTVLRLSVHKVYAGENSEVRVSEAKDRPIENKRQLFVASLVKKISGVSDMTEILKVLLANQFSAEGCSSLMYSDINVKKGKVRVFAAGGQFRHLKMGTSFKYEGTIAENIEKYKLDYLIVDDTFKSIKPIDWALFIPHGIRSYFAKPFYERNSLRTVLVFCSDEVGFFSEEQIPDYELLFEPFNKGLKNWRKANR